MRSDLKKGFIGLSLVFAALAASASDIRAGPWRELEQGLHLGGFFDSPKSILYDYPVVILKIDPAFFAFRLLSASEHDARTRSVKDWCEEFGLKAAINASMYLKEAPLKSTGFMKTASHVNNSRINPAFGAFMVFDPRESGIALVDIVDRRVEPEWEKIIAKYDTVIQNYRIISNGEAVEGWPRREQIYGTAAIGVDMDGRVLFVLSRAPYSTHDFIRILSGLPIGLRHAMYVEGGPEAALYLNLKKRKRNRAGTIEPGFMDSEGNLSDWRIPNVVGIERK